MTLDIMMPFWGRFDHFRLAVESVLAQTDPDWRLVIVDDVYPDPAPGAWAAAIDDPRVTYLRNEVNLGVSANFRHCVSMMSSEFAVIMGCDDIMRPNYVARIHELLADHPDVAIIQPGVRVVDTDGNPSYPLVDRAKTLYRFRESGVNVHEGEEVATSLLRGNWTYFPSLCWRVSHLREYGFRLDLDVVQDLAMLLTITIHGGKLLVDDDVCFDYRRHSASVSSWTAVDGSRFDQERQLFFEMATQLDAIGWHRAARAARGYLSSRINAATSLPRAIIARDGASLRALWRHIRGIPPTPLAREGVAEPHLDSEA